MASKETQFEEIARENILIDDRRCILVRISRNTKTGNTYLDIREFLTTERYTGFTKKGVNVPIVFADSIMMGIVHCLEK